MATHLVDRKYKNNAEFASSSAVKYVSFDCTVDGSAIQSGDIINVGTIPADTITTSVMLVIDEAFNGGLDTLDLIVVDKNDAIIADVANIEVFTAGIIILGNLGTTNVFNPDSTAYDGDDSIIYNQDSDVTYTLLYQASGVPTEGKAKLVLGYQYLDKTSEAFGLATQPLNIMQGRK